MIDQVPGWVLAGLLVVGVGVLVLGISGGGEVSIKEFAFKCPKIEASARIAFVILGLVMIMVAAYAHHLEQRAELQTQEEEQRRKDAERISVRGRLVPSMGFEEPNREYSVGLSLESDARKARLIPSDGHFTFHYDENIEGWKSGDYKLYIYEADRTLNEGKVTIENGENEVVIFYNPGHEAITIETNATPEKILARNFQRYKGSSWEDKVEVIRRTARYIEPLAEETQFSHVVVDMLGSENHEQRIFAALVIAEACYLQVPSARPVLKEIMQDTDEKMYRRIRAAHGVWCMNGTDDQRDVESFYWWVMHNEDTSARVAASRYISLHEHKAYRCVVEELLDGLRSSFQMSRALSGEGLRALPAAEGGDFGTDVDKWRQKLEPHYVDCPG